MATNTGQSLISRLSPRASTSNHFYRLLVQGRGIVSKTFTEKFLGDPEAMRLAVEYRDAQLAGLSPDSQTDPVLAAILRTKPDRKTDPIQSDVLVKEFVRRDHQGRAMHADDTIDDDWKGEYKHAQISYNEVWGAFGKAIFQREAGMEVLPTRLNGKHAQSKFARNVFEKYGVPLEGPS